MIISKYDEFQDKLKKALCYNTSIDKKTEDYSRMTCMIGFLGKDFGILGSDSLVTTIGKNPRDILNIERKEKIIAGNNRLVGIFGQTSFLKNDEKIDVYDFVNKNINNNDFKKLLIEYSEFLSDVARLEFGFVVLEKNVDLKMYVIFAKMVYPDLELPEFKVQAIDFSPTNPFFSIGYFGEINKKTSDNMDINIAKDILNIEIKADNYIKQIPQTAPPVQLYKILNTGEIENYSD